MLGNATGSAAGPTYTSTPILGVSGTAGTIELFPASGNFNTVLGTAATASSTVNLFASVPTTNHLISCVTATTTCTLTDSGILDTSAGLLTAIGTVPIANGGTNTTSAVAGAMPDTTTTTAASWTTTPTLGASGTAGTLAMYPSTGNFTTTWGSAATASNTILGFASAPTTTDLISCVTSSTTCTLTDSGIADTATGFNGVIKTLTGCNTATYVYTPQAADCVAPTAGGTVTSVATTSPITGGTFTTSGTIACATCVTSAAALTNEHVMLGGGLQASSTDSALDDGATTANTLTYTGTGGIVSPVYTANGTTAGFTAYTQGTTSSAVAPCNAATTICYQAPAAVTSYLVNLPGTAATGFVFDTNVSGTVTRKNVNTVSSIHNFNTTAQSQVTVAATDYYITNSDLDMPATYSTAIGAGTVMKWRTCMTKTAAGTVAFDIIIYKGTNGTTSDTAEVTQSIGVQTAAIDNMCCDVQLSFTSSTAAYWAIACQNKAITATGFGVATGATAFQSGTLSGLTSTTASDKYGLGFQSNTGTPTIVIPIVQAEAWDVN